MKSLDITRPVETPALLALVTLYRRVPQLGQQPSLTRCSRMLSSNLWGLAIVVMVMMSSELLLFTTATGTHDDGCSSWRRHNDDDGPHTSTQQDSKTTPHQDRLVQSAAPGEYKRESIYHHYLSSFSEPNYDLVLKVRPPDDVIHIQETPSGVYLKRQLTEFLREASQIKTSKSCKFDSVIVCK